MTSALLKVFLLLHSCGPWDDENQMKDICLYESFFL